MSSMDLKKHRRKLLLLAIYFSLPLFLAFTNPNNLALPLLVAPFILLFIIFFVTFSALVRSPNRRKKVLIAATGASVPVLLLIFQSMHQLTIKDVLLVGGLVGITIFYLSRADFIR